MTDNPSFWMRLMWKLGESGWSVLTNGVTALIVALIAKATWGWKIKQELELAKKKKEAELKIEQFEKVVQPRLNFIKNLKTSREQLASEVERPTLGFPPSQICGQYSNWLATYGLIDVKQNRERCRKWSSLFESTRLTLAEEDTPEGTATRLEFAADVRATDLPDGASDRTFDWQRFHL